MTSVMPWINLNGIIYNSDQLKSGSIKSDNNTFENSTLQFCQEWLTGKQEFKLQTSGSTGSPKIMKASREQMEASARLTIKALQLRSNDTGLVCLDTKYIAGQMMLVRCMTHGMNIVAIDPSSNPFDKIPLSQSVDFAAFVPYQLETILNSTYSLRLAKLKCAIIGGAPIDLKTKKALHSSACRFYATYGMTETLSHIALQQLNGEQSQDYFQVLDQIVIGKDARGCLTIQANYLGPEKVITNDLVEIIDQQKFKWLGRWDTIINSGGVKVVPEKVESKVQEIFDELNLMNRFFVFGLPDEKLHQKVTLIIEGLPFAADTQGEIEMRLKDKLDHYTIPKELKFIPSFLETENGKVKRSETASLVPIRAQ